MKETTIGVLIFVIFIQLCVALIVPNLIDINTGDAVAPESVNLTQGEAPTAWDAVSWIWTSITFAFGMTTFTIAEMPAAINTIWVFMNLLTVLCIVFLARGGGN